MANGIVNGSSRLTIKGIIEFFILLVASATIVYNAMVWAGDQKWEPKGEAGYQILSVYISQLEAKKSAGKLEAWEEPLLIDYKRQLKNIERDRNKRK